MQDIFGSVRRSPALRSNPAKIDDGCGNRTRVATNDDATPIRWRKGALIGCGAFGQVYMWMNMNSRQLLAVKQVLLGTNIASKEKAHLRSCMKAHISELEEEVKHLTKLSHPNIVRYFGTVREEETLNILLEFVHGESISSLLDKSKIFPEAIIKKYIKQLLQGLEYLHSNGIIHGDIKCANIFYDIQGCIKLADFGAFKQVAILATMTEAKSMKRTPCWMAPEVILQAGHSFSADIWSVGCTLIEMATGKPSWSQQFEEVAGLFHIGTTKSHPPIPDFLSSEATSFLLKCLQKEPNLRPTASDLLKDPFFTEDEQSFRTVDHSLAESSDKDAHSALDLNELQAPMYDECINKFIAFFAPVDGNLKLLPPSFNELS